MNKKSSQPIVNFTYKLTSVMILLCALVLLLCVAGIGVTVYRMILNGGVVTIDDLLKYPFLIAVCLFCIALIIALLVKSQYSVTKDELITQFGFIKTRYELKKITKISQDRDLHKLTVNFDEEFVVLTCSPNWADDLVSAILKVNPNIEYSYTLTENKPQNEE